MMFPSIRLKVRKPINKNIFLWDDYGKQLSRSKNHQNIGRTHQHKLNFGFIRLREKGQELHVDLGLHVDLLISLFPG